MVTAASVGGRGVQQLAALSVALKDQANRGLKNELAKSLRRATKKPIGIARQNARDRLPRKGGLAELVAGSKISTRNRITGKNPSITVVAANPNNIRAVNAGKVRHPVFGRETNWTVQTVPAGWWSDAWKEGGPDAKREVAAALRETSRKLGRAAS